MGAWPSLGVNLLLFILALAICKINARREPRSCAPDVSVHTDDPETNEVVALCCNVMGVDMTLEGFLANINTRK